MNKGIYKRLTLSLSYTLPILVVSGVLFSISTFFQSAFGSYLYLLGNYAFYIAYSVLSAGIAFAIADRVAIVPALIGGYLLKDGTMGLLGAVIVGFFVGYLVKACLQVFEGVPKTMSGILTVFVIPVIVTAIAIGLVYLMNTYIDTWFDDAYLLIFYRYAWLVIALSVLGAAFMAYDLGGPVNKIVYMIAIASIVNGLSSTLMAAVIAGGMIPPLTASVMTLFRKKEENQTWWMTGLLGLFFMTEGAIPFAERNRKWIIPIMMIGSGIAGGIVGWFSLATRIPHGGILIVFFMTNWYYFLLALIIGVVITSILLIVFASKINLKKTPKKPLQA